MIDSCEPCLRRGYLLAHLAPRIAGLLQGGRPRQAGLLSLTDRELIVAAAGRRVARALAFLDAFDDGAERRALSRAGITVVCHHSEAYPRALLELDDAPAILFGVGREHALRLLGAEPAVALVGSRAASPYGTEVAYALGRGLGAAGVPVVSGLALGIDATAHKGCLDGGGVPIAVLACGPDVVYPRRHRGLHQRVREAGMVLSELPPGTEPFLWSFPARNRIMAALAQMTVVVEAAQPSGSLITSEFAKDLGRSVAAVPGLVTSSLARGTNGLLRDGAVPVTATADVLDELFGAGVRKPVLLPGVAEEPTEPLLRAVLAEVERCSSVEAVADATGLAVGEVRAALGRLEVEGHLVRRDLGGWERAAR